MVKQQRIIREKQKNPVIVDRKSRIPALDPKYANAPVRAVHFVEVGGMSGAQVGLLMSELGRLHDTAKGGIHYVLPVRNGKIGADLVFEEEWLAVVQKTCCVNEDGKIVLQGGAKEVLVIRQSV